MALRWRKKNLDDQALLRAYKKTGDKALVGTLYERYVHLVMGICVKYLRKHEDAQDATMQIFEKLLHDLIDQDVSNFKNWLWSVARNHCLMQLRKQNKEILTDSPEFADDAGELEIKMAREGQLEAIETTLKSLSDEQRTCVKLFYLEQRSYKEIAGLTGLELKKVKSHIQNGKRNLTLKLKEHG